MDKMIVVIFDTENKAYEALRALSDLHDEGSLAVFAGSVIAKDTGGKVSIKQTADQGPVNAALGMATGALIGALAGPAGVAAGAVTGALGGSMFDFANLGVGSDFIDEVSGQLGPGKAALVAEIEEDWVTPLDTRMEALGGTVLRRPRVEVIDAQMERDAAALQAELDQLHAEFEQATGEAKAKLQAKIKSAKSRLEKARSRAKTRVEELHRQTEARIQAMRDQSAKAVGETKQRLTHRIEEIKADHAARSDKLRQAWRLTKEAVSPARQQA
jgi:uncharacterized membrane protein